MKATVIGVDFELPGNDDPRRIACRSWLAQHPNPTHSQLAEAGLVAPAWPAPWGLGADAEHQIIISEELAHAEVSLPDNPIGIGWAGPTLLAAGSEEQKRRYLKPLLSGEEFWSQLFSEPDSGSDLSSLRTTAVLDGDEWVINGQKLWSTWAERSKFGILLARTEPDASQHQGISYFICPMDLPGIEIREIREMSGGHHFNEVFFDNLRIPADCLVGERGEGWRLARITLGNERVSLSTGGGCWGMGPTSGEFFDILRTRGGLSDPVERQRAATLYTEAFLISLLGRKILSELLAGREPGTEASLKKLLADEHGQHITECAADLAGPASMLAGEDAIGPLGVEPGEWPWAFLFARALTIGGGTTQVQRNIVAERILGLPREQSGHQRSAAATADAQTSTAETPAAETSTAETSTAERADQR